MSMPTFYCNKIKGDLVVIRKEDLPNGTRPQDAVGKGFHVIEAPCSERARSMLAARRSAAEVKAQRDAVWVLPEAA